jgi:hypothetical protein
MGADPIAACTGLKPFNSLIVLKFLSTVTICGGLVGCLQELVPSEGSLGTCPLVRIDIEWEVSVGLVYFETGVVF